jgi:phosphoglycolate phosphatase
MSTDSPPADRPLVVGFDLDMTLLDTRPGIAATYRALVEVTGVPIDVDLVVSRLGPPLAHELANWFPASAVDEAVGIYRSLYSQCAITVCPPLPGAMQALEAVRAAGGRTAVITAKFEPFAAQHLRHAGFPVDTLVGDAFADGKSRALRAIGATIFVGDHMADARAAVTAGSSNGTPDRTSHGTPGGTRSETPDKASHETPGGTRSETPDKTSGETPGGRRNGGVTAVGVLTGPHNRTELLSAGASVVLSDLTEFPAWLKARG